ncbi:MAG: tyrosine--tRNA ligase [Candidatus Krumholzibacteriia bacterium]|nr:tyrosine--tRNA ligase [Candidatus Latescibacterota bacterium]
MLPVKQQLDIIQRGAEEILPLEELQRKLERAVAQNRPLIVKQGFDPTAPDLHLGHAVGLRKLRQFQDLGHRVVFLIGDFTGLIGDPSGRSETRKAMTREDVIANAETYRRQVGKILDMDRLEVRFNSEWCAPLTFEDVLRLASQYTVARMLERDDFAKRYADGRPISIMEFLYPLVQGYDSVMLEADIEVGGTDQKFNLLVGRQFQQAHGQEPQVILTLPLLEGISGDGEKMSKSLGNTIGIMEPAGEIFGKTMSIPDALLPVYFRLASALPAAEVEEDLRALEAGGVNPVLLKRKLGRHLADLYAGEGQGAEAEAAFDRIFVQKDLPEDMPEGRYPAGEELWIVRLLQEGGLVKSASDARRMLGQGAVSVDGLKVEDPDFNLRLEPGGEAVIKVGKRRFFKVLAS